MTPETIIQNLTTLVQTALIPLGTLAAVAGTALFAGGKATDSPQVIRWGKNSWMGAVIAFSGAAVVSLTQYLATRIFG